MAKFLLAMLPAFLAVPASTPIAAGRWAISNQIEEALFDGQRDPDPFPPSKPHSVCLSAANAAQGPGLAFSDLDLCKVLKSSVQDGAFEFETECKATESNDTILTRASGRYTSDRYDGTSTSVQHRNGMKIEMRSRMEAQRVGGC